MVQIKHKGVYGVRNPLPRSFLGGLICEVKTKHQWVAFQVIFASNQNQSRRRRFALISSLCMAMWSKESTSKSCISSYIHFNERIKVVCLYFPVICLYFPPFYCFVKQTPHQRVFFTSNQWIKKSSRVIWIYFPRIRLYPPPLFFLYENPTWKSYISSYLHFQSENQSRRG